MPYQEADHILIPLLDGTACVAQVARVAAGRVLIHITQRRATAQDATVPILREDIWATLVVDLGALPDGHWPITGYDALPHDLRTTQADLTDPDPMDPAIVEAFANALQGLYPWDGFPDPDFFTKLLRRPDQLPSERRMAADLPRAAD